MGCIAWNIQLNDVVALFNQLQANRMLPQVLEDISADFAELYSSEVRTRAASAGVTVELPPAYEPRESAQVRQVRDIEAGEALGR